MTLARKILANTDDVGDKFAEEARRIHYGEAAERGIRGRASPEQTEARLRDWFALTERHAAQLHELDLDQYLREKHADLARPPAATP